MQSFKVDRSGNNATRRAIAEELHKPVKRIFYRRDVHIRDIKDMFQCDLIEMQPYANYNHGHRYILAVVDSFSKYGWVRPIKRKTMEATTAAMRDILQSPDGAPLKPPKLLCSDQGKEFYNSKFRQLMREYGIHHFSVYSNLKACLVERFNRTIKNAIYKEFTIRGSFNYLTSGVLDKVIYEYNHRRVHRTIGMRPADLLSRRGVNQRLRRQLQKMYARKHANKEARKNNAFRVGDNVRVTRLKSTFEKGYTANWSSEIYVVDKVNPTFPVTYQLRDKINGDPIAGCWYHQELLKTNFPDTYLVEKVLQRGTGQRQGEVYCKFVGQPEENNAWISINKIA